MFIVNIFLVILIIFAVVVYLWWLEKGGVEKAICVIKGDKDDKINGVVHFEKTNFGTHIYGKITGLDEGKHGFHIHTYGDISKGCESLGGHYNPLDKDHGDRVKVGEDGKHSVNLDRHVGDLGNIEANSRGESVFDFYDTLINIDDIIGRSIVVHAGKDDLGLGDNAESKVTGNSGKRVGCGIIALVG